MKKHVSDVAWSRFQKQIELNHNFRDECRQRQRPRQCLIGKRPLCRPTSGRVTSRDECGPSRDTRATPAPTNKTRLRHFLGIAAYMATFISYKAKMSTSNGLYHNSRHSSEFNTQSLFKLPPEEGCHNLSRRISQTSWDRPASRETNRICQPGLGRDEETLFGHAEVVA